jgi:hypothetical protein
VYTYYLFRNQQQQSRVSRKFNNDVDDDRRTMRRSIGKAWLLWIVLTWSLADARPRAEIRLLADHGAGAANADTTATPDEVAATPDVFTAISDLVASRRQQHADNAEKRRNDNKKKRSERKANKDNPPADGMNKGIAGGGKSEVSIKGSKASKGKESQGKGSQGKASKVVNGEDMEGVFCRYHHGDCKFCHMSIL